MNPATVLKLMSALKLFGPLLKKVRVDEVNVDMLRAILLTLKIEPEDAVVEELMGSLAAAATGGANKNLYDFLLDPRTAMTLGKRLIDLRQNQTTVDEDMDTTVMEITRDTRVFCPECRVYHPIVF